jgi:hypothetical protein
VVARHQRHAGSFHQRLGRRLAAHGVDGAGRWAEEDQPGLFDGAGEAGVLRQKAIARVDGLGAAGLGGGDQLVDQQVAVGGLAAAQVDADVGFAAVAGVTVGGAVHGHGGQAHGLGGAHHPAGDFAAVGDQQGGQTGRLMGAAPSVIGLPGGAAFFQEGAQALLAFGADADTGDGVLAVAAQGRAEFAVVHFAQQVLGGAQGLGAVVQQVVTRLRPGRPVRWPDTPRPAGPVRGHARR